MTHRILAAAVAAAFAAGAAAEQKQDPHAAGGTNAKWDFEKLDRNNDGSLSRGEWPAERAGQGAAAGASGEQGSAAVVLVPFVVAQAPDFGEGCWARLYDGQNYEGNQLTVLGPGNMPNLRTGFGRDWSGSFDSLHVGPKATLTVYDNEDYAQRVATYKPNQRIADLGETRDFFEDIRSLRISCASGGRTAQQDSGPSQAGTGGTKKQKQQ